MTTASPEKPSPEPGLGREVPAPVETEQLRLQCLCQGESCSLSAAAGHTKRLTIIKPCCQVMVGLARHPGETEALSTLRCITCLDGAHLKCGNALHLGAKGEPWVTTLPWSHPCPKSGTPEVGAWHCSAPPTLCRCLGSPGSATCTAGGSPGAGPDRDHMVGNTDLADKVLVEGPI